MNATQIDQLREVLECLKFSWHNIGNSSKLHKATEIIEGMLAAAKEEHGKVLTMQEIDALCDAYHGYVKNRYPDTWAEMSAGFEAGVRAVSDSGYLAPAPPDNTTP